MKELKNVIKYLQARVDGVHDLDAVSQTDKQVTQYHAQIEILEDILSELRAVYANPPKEFEIAQFKNLGSEFHNHFYIMENPNGSMYRYLHADGVIKHGCVMYDDNKLTSSGYFETKADAEKAIKKYKEKTLPNLVRKYQKDK